MLSNYRTHTGNDILLPQIASLLESGTHTVTLLLHGNSMQPFLEGGRDSVLLQHPGTYRRNDVVLAEIAPLQYVLH